MCDHFLLLFSLHSSGNKTEDTDSLKIPTEETTEDKLGNPQLDMLDVENKTYNPSSGSSTALDDKEHDKANLDSRSASDSNLEANPSDKKESCPEDDSPVEAHDAETSSHNREGQGSKQRSSFQSDQNKMRTNMQRASGPPGSTKETTPLDRGDKNMTVTPLLGAEASNKSGAPENSANGGNAGTQSLTWRAWLIKTVRRGLGYND